VSFASGLPPFASSCPLARGKLTKFKHFNPVADEYAVGQVYLPQNESLRHKSRTIIEKVVQEVSMQRLVTTSVYCVPSLSLVITEELHKEGSRRQMCLCVQSWVPLYAIQGLSCLRRGQESDPYSVFIGTL